MPRGFVALASRRQKLSISTWRKNAGETPALQNLHSCGWNADPRDLTQWRRLAKPIPGVKLLENSIQPGVLESAFDAPPWQIIRGVAALGLFLLSCLTATVCRAQNRDVVCREGEGDFEAEFLTGVKVRVGPARFEDLESRVCAVIVFSWGDQESADHGLRLPGRCMMRSAWTWATGTPVAALQVKKSKTECCMEYKIYSLRAPPVLLHTITGGEFFSAADTDLDGRVEIWTDDAAAVEGVYENLLLRDLDFAPPMILRFARDAGCWRTPAFRSSNPSMTRKSRTNGPETNPQDLGDFKSSDGKLATLRRFAGRLALPPARREDESTRNRLVLSLQRPGRGRLARSRRDVAGIGS